MKEMLRAIRETLANPDVVVQSKLDPEVRLSFRRYVETPVSDKYLCVVCKHQPKEAFIITAYLTDRIKQGEILWAKTV